MDYRFGTLSQQIIGPNLREGARLPDPLDFWPWTPQPEILELSPDDMAAEFDRTFH